MIINDLKSEFSHAYARAVAHAAGYFIQEANRAFDSDGIDLTMLNRDPNGAVRSPRLDLQLKATAVIPTGDPFTFDLPVKNYDELRSDELQVPRILVVVIVPEDIHDWVSASEEELILRRCGYWASFRGQPATSNEETKRVLVPRSNCFHVDAVRGIMERIRQGALP